MHRIYMYIYITTITSICHHPMSGLQIKFFSKTLRWKKNNNFSFDLLPVYSPLSNRTSIISPHSWRWSNSRSHSSSFSSSSCNNNNNLFTIRQQTCVCMCLQAETRCKDSIRTAKHLHRSIHTYTCS